MNTNAMITASRQTFGKMSFALKRHSPEILLVTGIVSAIGGTVLACKATTKASEIVKSTKEEVEMIHECMENPELSTEYTKEDSQKDLAITYTKCAVKLAKNYAPAVAVGVFSLGCILASHNILRQRNMAFAAAYATLDKSFKSYRERVADELGNEVENKFRHNIKAMEVTETLVDAETGEEKTVTKTVETTDLPWSEYSRFFDEGNPNWEKNADFNLMFLHSQQTYANQLLRARGYLFLNEVYDALGFPKTKAGQIVGWIYNGNNEIDFGIYDISKQSTRDFINGYERTFLMDFNVDGPIIDKVRFEV